MSIRSFGYHIKEAFRSIFGNPLMTFASTITIISCLVVLSATYIIYVNLDFNIGRVQASENGIEVFFDDDIKDNEQKVELLGKKFRSLDVVSNVKFISHEDAKKRALSAVEGEEIKYYQDIEFPESYIIFLKNEKEMKKFVEQLEDISGIAEVKYDAVVTSALVSLRDFISGVSFVFIAVLTFISILLIVNTIQLNIQARKYEIGVMKYIGATDWFLKWPFILEGVIIGLISSFISYGVLKLTYNSFLDSVKGSEIIQSGIFAFKTFTEINDVIILITAVIGVAIGVIGTNISIRRHLKV